MSALASRAPAEDGVDDDCPILADLLSAGAEVHLPPGRSAAASGLARFANGVGLAAALTFASANPAPVLAEPAAVTVPARHVAEPEAEPAIDPKDGLGGLPRLFGAPIPILDEDDGPETWRLRGTIDDRLTFRGPDGNVRVRRSLAEIIVEAARETGAEPDVMMAMADKESGFDPRAEADGSSAVGLFQFLEGTWLAMVRRAGARHGLAAEARSIRIVDGEAKVADPAERTRILAMRSDPRLASLMACELYLLQKASLESRLGAPPTPSEAYMAHLLGMGGASKFLKEHRDRPQAEARKLFPQAAKANPGLFAERGRHRTVREVHGVVTRQIDARVARYSDVAERLAPVTIGYPGR